MSNRREARECVMQALYAHEVSSGDAEHLVDSVLAPALGDDARVFHFARTLFARTFERISELDALISDYAENWDLDRIAPVDRVLLRMAACELLTFENIPPKVSINEAIDIAKAYSTERSGSFVNGILDALLMDLHRQGRLQKTGRGLVGMDSIRERASQ